MLTLHGPWPVTPLVSRRSWKEGVEDAPGESMEDHKLQALHDTLSKLRGRHGLGTSSLYSWQRNSSQGAAAKTPPSAAGGNPLHAHFHREGEHPHRSLARGDGDGRVIKRDFKDLEDPDRSSPVGDDGRKGKKKRRRNEEDEDDDDDNKKKKSKEEKKREKKAARKAAKLEMKRQAKLEEKRLEKRAAKAKQESPPLDKSAEALEMAKSQPSPPGGDRSRSKEKKRKEGKKKSGRKEKELQRPEEQSAGESSSPASLLAQPPAPGASKKKKRKVSRKPTSNK
jgi:hypothetical protein